MLDALGLPLHPSGLWRWLNRFGFSWKRSRFHVHSPDPDYELKKTLIEELHTRVRRSEGRLGLMYLDEVSISSKPTGTQTWWAQGARLQPTAELGHKSEKALRVVAVLDALDGRVMAWVRKAITAGTIRQFLRAVRTRMYPDVERLYVVVDNWPVHYHPRVLQVLEPQESRFARKVPPSWPAFDPGSRAADALPIQLVSLPTYASWLNPIEKLWRKVRQELTHLHPWADLLPSLRKHLEDYFDRLLGPQPALMHYVGLTADRFLSDPPEVDDVGSD